MNDQIYAPVCIPTLNRYKHLSQCIEALAQNPLAKYTELYISVDYPPNQNYTEGYNKVCEYLKRGVAGFKEVHLFWQKKNLGAYRNMDFLKKLVISKYDYFICLEDDQIVSANFLDYMNQALQEYKDNPKVAGIGGRNEIMFHVEKKAPVYADVMEKMGYNVFMDYSGAHIGTWSAKETELVKRWNFDFLYKIITSKELSHKLINISKQTYTACVNGYLYRAKYMFYENTRQLSPIDYARLIWGIVNDYYTVLPTKAKMKTIGLDGSGLHCEIVPGGDPAVLDTDQGFMLKPCDKYDPEGILALFPSTELYDKKSFIIARFLAFWCCNFGRKSAIRMGKIIDFFDFIYKKIYRIIWIMYRPIKN